MVERTDSPMDDAELTNKRLKLNHEDGGIDQKKPIFLKLNFKRAASPTEEEPVDPLIEDDETYYARPWEQRSTEVPLLLAFRMQFDELFDGVPDLGPQDIEEGIYSLVPGEDVMKYVCKLLTLALNRPKPVE